MALPTTATLAYAVTATNPSAADLATAIAAVVLYTNALTDPVLLGKYGVTVFSDTTTNVAGVVTRTIVLTLSATFFAEFPSAASWVGAFPDFYTHTLAQAVQCGVGDGPGQLAAAAVVFA